MAQEGREKKNSEVATDSYCDNKKEDFCSAGSQRPNEGKRTTESLVRGARAACVGVA